MKIDEDSLKATLPGSTDPESIHQRSALLMSLIELAEAKISSSSDTDTTLN